MQTAVLASDGDAQQDSAQDNQKFGWRQWLNLGAMIVSISLLVISVYVGHHIRHNPLARMAFEISCGSMACLLLQGEMFPKWIRKTSRAIFYSVGVAAAAMIIASVFVFPARGGFSENWEGTWRWTAVRVAASKNGPPIKAHYRGWHYVALGKFVDWITVEDRKIEFPFFFRDREGLVIEAKASATVRLEHDDDRLAEFAVSVPNLGWAIYSAADTAMRKCLAEKLEGRSMGEIWARTTEVSCPFRQYSDLPAAFEDPIKVTEIYPIGTSPRP